MPKQENPYLEGRKVRLQQVREIIREIGQTGISHKKLVAVASWDLGIKEKTLNSYMETLKDLGHVVWDVEGKVWKCPE